jgi:hypothetical protein
VTFGNGLGREQEGVVGQHGRILNAFGFAARIARDRRADRLSRRSPGSGSACVE